MFALKLNINTIVCYKVYRIENIQTSNLVRKKQGSEVQIENCDTTPS